MSGKRRPDAFRSLHTRDDVISNVIPIRLLLITGVLALLLGLAANEWIGIALIVFAVCASVIVIMWARAQGDLLVTAVALLLFWMPFQVTQTRFNVSPQELGVYILCIVCALFDRRGIRQWIVDLLTTTAPLMRLALLVFILACLQSFMRVAQPDLIASANTFHTVILYPVLFGLLIAYTMRSRGAIGMLLKPFVAGAATLAAYALVLQMWGVEVGNGAVAGRLGSESSFLAQYHPNNLSLYFVLALAFVPAVMGETLRSHRISAVKTLGVFMAAMILLLAVWLTYSRGALGALLLGIVVALGTLAVGGRGSWRRVAIGILGTGIGGIVTLTLLKGTDLFGRYASLLNPLSLSSDPDTIFRIRLYTRALQVTSEHPISGIGLQQFATTGSVPFSPHSTYLDLWVGTGIFGMLAFALVLLLGLGTACAGVRSLSRGRHTVELLYILGFVAALVAFMVQAFVETYDANQRIAPIAFMLALGGNCALQALTGQRKSIPNTELASISLAEPLALAEPVPSGQNERRAGHFVGGPEMLQEQRDNPASPPPHANRHNWNAPDDDWDDPAVWSRETMMLPAWQFQAGDIDQWKVDSAHLPAIGRGARSPQASARKEAQEPATREADEPKHSNESGEEMLRRAPTSFIWNQIYAMWFFATGFVLSIVITRGLSRDDYGIYAVLTTMISTITFICAIGLEDAATVFLPRIQTKDGPEAAGTLIRRLLVTRILIIGTAGLAIAIGLMVAAPFFIHLGITPAFFDESTGGPVGMRAILIGLYLVGSSISTLQIAFFSALLKSRIVLLIGGFSQVASVTGVFVLLKAGWGIDGAFAGQAVVAWFTVLAYLVPLSTVIFARGKITSVRRGEMRKLMVGAWLTNVSNTALGKQMDIMVMTAFAVGSAAIGYYNLAYQLGSIIGVVLISGLGGVGMAAMSAALSTGGPKRLISMWRASIMLQVILAVPLQTVCFVFADQIVTVLYGSDYAGAVTLLRVFLAFTMFGRLIGGGASQGALYVIGKQRSVVVLRWSGLIINVILDVTLIQVYGPIGAMIATGFSQVWVGLMEYLLLRLHLGTEYPIAFAGRVTGVAAFAALLVLWWAPGGLIGLAAEFTLFGALFAFGLWITSSEGTNDLTELMLANPRLKAIVTRVGRFMPRIKPATVTAST